MWYDITIPAGFEGQDILAAKVEEKCELGQRDYLLPIHTVIRRAANRYIQRAEPGKQFSWGNGIGKLYNGPR